MIQIQEKHNCSGCQACAQACPKGCISMLPDQEGFLYPVVDESVCISCGLCEKICPVLHSTGQKRGEPKAYAACNVNEEVRLASSSGGVFTLLAEYVLQQAGVVYGAAMVASSVRHIRVEDREDLELLRGSKYVQSDVGRTYIQAREDLEAGRTVLFTGTPCQIEGLKSFLRKDYEYLFTMDIICHGVPSPMVWEKYVALREKEAGASASQIFFRDKKYGWKNYSVLVEFSNKSVYVRSFHDDLFMKAFLYDLCLRPSCYRCSFKKENRVSDITVADFWGVQNICPEMDDDKGTSLVLVHSQRGQRLFDFVVAQMRCREVCFEEAIKGNPAMIRAAAIPKHRNTFMKMIHTEELGTVVRKYAKSQTTVKGFIKRILEKIGLLQVVKRILNVKH